MPTPISALDADGNKYWYTGRAGREFVAIDRAQAFLGFDLEGARRKAAQLNRMSSVHGLLFCAVASPDDTDAHRCRAYLEGTAAADPTTSWLDATAATPFDQVRKTTRGYCCDVEWRQTRERYQQQLAEIALKAEAAE